MAHQTTEFSSKTDPDKVLDEFRQQHKTYSLKVVRAFPFSLLASFSYALQPKACNLWLQRKTVVIILARSDK